jgi:hypothetical protein
MAGAYEILTNGIGHFTIFWEEHPWRCATVVGDTPYLITLVYDAYRLIYLYYVLIPYDIIMGSLRPCLGPTKSYPTDLVRIPSSGKNTHGVERL